MNLARENPHFYVPIIQAELNSFKPDGASMPLYPGCDYRTNEGKGAWEECLKVMSESPSLPGLKLSKSLSLVAQSHANDMSAHNFMDHIGSDGADLSERIDRFC